MIFGCKINDSQKVAPKRIRKTPQGKHKMLQDAPKTAQNASKTPPRRPKAPKTAPGRPQDAPMTPPGRSKTPPRSGKIRDQKRIVSGPPPNLDFGASWVRFWEVLASILGGVLDGFKELKTHKIQKKLGGFGINFEKCFGWF